MEWFTLVDRSITHLFLLLPAKSDLFQRDLYPDTAALEPALQADQWIAGQDALPLRVSLSGGYTTPGSKQKDTQPSKVQLVSQDSGPPAASVVTVRPSPAAKEPEEDVQQLQVVAKDTDVIERPKREVRHNSNIVLWGLLCLYKVITYHLSTSFFFRRIFWLSCWLRWKPYVPLSSPRAKGLSC